MARNVMIDLETMSTESNAAICSIGAVSFDPDRGEIDFNDTFYRVIDAKDCKALGLHFSKDTVAWWSTQPREVLEMLRKDPLPLAEGVDDFMNWYGTKSIPIWGCGSDFDNVILSNAIKAVKRTPPWKFWHNRCYRTMKAIIQIPEEPRDSSYHNALSDAKHQARHLLKILGS